MRLAIAAARAAQGRTHPNPAVGAVILHRGEPVASGHTQPPGGDHAEIVALRRFRERGLQPDAGTTLVVTLEPCSTRGRTGACTEAILASGIRRVVAGATDPNPAHRGRGFAILREAGLEVRTGVLADECADLNLIFNWRMEHGAPLFAGKIATTLDGRIATRGGFSKWITGPAARQDAHRWRRYFPAIAVGSGTVLIDDPALTARIGGEPEWCPLRFVFDRSLVTLRDPPPRVYADPWRDRTILVTGDPRGAEAAAARGLRCWVVEEQDGDGGLADFARRCRREEIGGVLVDGGSRLLSGFLKYRLLHYLLAYRSPHLLADAAALAPFTGQAPARIEDAIRLGGVRHATFGDDQLMRGFVVYPGA